LNTLVTLDIPLRDDSDQRYLQYFPTRRSSDLTELTRRQRQREREDLRERTSSIIRQLMKKTDAEIPPETGPVLDRIQNWLRYRTDRKSTRLNSSHLGISYAVFCLKIKNVM